MSALSFREIRYKFVKSRYKKFLSLRVIRYKSVNSWWISLSISPSLQFPPACGGKVKICYIFPTITSSPSLFSVILNPDLRQDRFISESHHPWLYCHFRGFLPRPRRERIEVRVKTGISLEKKVPDPRFCSP